MSTVAEYRTLAANAMTEADLQAQVLSIARTCRWLVYHTHDSRRSEPGFPDLVLTRRGRLIFAELKSERGRLSEPQQQWLFDLRMVDFAEVHCWRPADLMSGAVAAVLK